MMDFEIMPYPGENEDSFTKRKAYYLRIIEPRIRLCIEKIPRKIANGKAISLKDIELIDDFWSRYLTTSQRAALIDDRYYKVYNKVLREGDKLCEYIPDSFYYLFIDDYYTNPQHSNPCDDKNLYDLYFHDINRPVTVFRKTNGFFLDDNYREISLNDAISMCENENEVILKKGKFSYGGMGIMFWSSQQSKDDLLEFLNESPNVICQRVIKQHEELSRLNPTSVNTIRIMSLVLEGQTHILSSVVRIGVNGSRVDNASSGGIVCGIKQNGQLKDVAYSAYCERFLEHPQGMKFENVIIPNFDECLSLVTKLAKRFCSVSRLISWDLAIGEDGHPILIEFNLSCGELDFHQYCNGPIFGEMTEDVLKDVFSNSFTLNSILKSI